MLMVRVVCGQTSRTGTFIVADTPHTKLEFSNALPCARYSSKCTFCSALLSQRKGNLICTKLFSSDEHGVVLQEDQLRLLLTLSCGSSIMPFLTSEFLRLALYLSSQQDCIYSLQIDQIISDHIVDFSRLFSIFGFEKVLMV